MQIRTSRIRYSVEFSGSDCIVCKFMYTHARMTACKAVPAFRIFARHPNFLLNWLSISILIHNTYRDKKKLIFM